MGDVGRAVQAQGVKFYMTLNHSHVIFKIDNVPEQEIGNVRLAMFVAMLKLAS